MFYIHILEENLHRPPKGKLTFENPLENVLAFFAYPYLGMVTQVVYCIYRNESSLSC